MPENCGGAKIFLVHGTWARGFHPDKYQQAEAADKPVRSRWFESGSTFCATLNSGLARAANYTEFPWSGANSIEERRSAAIRLAGMVDESIVASPESAHVIIAHSHGGNVALDARQAMSSDVRNVHIITMATPFLSIQRRKTGIADRLFAVLISVTIIAFSIYYSRAWAYADGNFFLFSSLFISLSSLALGSVMLASGLHRKIRKKPDAGGPLSKIPGPVRRVNNQSLLAGGILSCAASLYAPSDMAEIVPLLLLVSLPVLLLFFILLSVIENCLFNHESETTTNNQGVFDNIPNVTILRSRRDEATLALFFGKITSVVSRLAASISIVVSLGAVLLILLLLSLVMYYAISEYDKFEMCVAELRGRTNHGQCVFRGEENLLSFITAASLSEQLSYYFAFGFYVCIALIFLTALCKSFFGRELLYRSLNTVVDVCDTPGCADSYKVDWCAQREGGGFGLRHSLYNNPEALEKIVACLKEVGGPADNRRAG